MAQVEAEREALRKELDARNITEEELERLSNEHLQLEKEWGNFQAKIDEMQKEMWELEMQAEKQRRLVTFYAQEGFRK